MDLTEQNIHTLMRQLKLYFSHELKDTGITPSELMILSELYLEDGLSQDELAERVSVDKAAAARTIQSMEKKDLVLRRQGIRNRRSKEVYLSQKGLSLKSRVRQLQEAWVEYVSQDMSEQERKLFSRQLQNMAERSRQLNH